MIKLNEGYNGINSMVICQVHISDVRSISQAMIPIACPRKLVSMNIRMAYCTV